MVHLTNSAASIERVICTLQQYGDREGAATQGLTPPASKFRWYWPLPHGRGTASFVLAESHAISLDLRISVL